MKKIVFTSVILFSLLVTYSYAEVRIASDYYKDFTFETKHSKTCIEIISYLNKYHYSGKNLDDELSSKIFDRYLKDLDYNKLIFLEQDIKDFEKYRYLLDDYIKSGNIFPAVSIYSDMHKRSLDRTVYYLNSIESSKSDIDLTQNEFIETDPDKRNRAESLTELKNFWRKRLKNEYLNLSLAEKTDKEIKDVLLKRYENHLNRLKQIKDDDAFLAFMNSVTNTYGPHTEYYSPHLYENFDIQMKLSLEGIGAQLRTENEYTKIVELITAGPAEKSKKLKAGDLIVSVGEGKKGELVNVVGWRLDEVVKLIRGPKGSFVKLEILPANSESKTKTKIVEIKRDKVKLEEQAAKSELFEYNMNEKIYKIGLITIPTFYLDFNAYQKKEKDYKSTTRDVKKLIKELEKSHVDGIIIDLRNNGGGSLLEANNLTGLFIEKGPVVQVRGENGYIEEYQDKIKSIDYKGPLIVMVNRLSASASEIFAGAIQDYNRGLIIGNRTFGKGTVQSIIKLKFGQLKLTRAKFYRVSGESTQNRGVLPDISFPDIYNHDEIGESSLPEALEWDTVSKSRYKKFVNEKLDLTNLNQNYIKRTNENPDFQYLFEEIEYINQKSDETLISLNKETRITENNDADLRRLNSENKKRISKGLKPFDTIEDIDTDEIDLYLDETKSIMADYIYKLNFN